MVGGAAALFAFGHANQEGPGVVRTAIVGALFTALVAVLDSL